MKNLLIVCLLFIMVGCGNIGVSNSVHKAELIFGFLDQFERLCRMQMPSATEAEIAECVLTNMTIVIELPDLQKECENNEYPVAWCDYLEL